MDISIPRKTDYTLSVELSYDDDTVFSTGEYDIFFTVRKKTAPTSVTDDEDAVISKKNTKELTEEEETITTVFDISRDDTNVDIATYIYDVQVLDPDKKMFQVKFGNLEITSDVTRSNDE